MNTETNIELLKKIQNILKSCSTEFYDHLHEEFVELYKEQKMEIERNMNFWNETLRLDLKNAFCDLNNSYKQSFKEVFMKISHINNDMKMKMLEFEKELKKLYSNQNHLLLDGMNRPHRQNEDIDDDNIHIYCPLSEENEAGKKSIIHFDTQRRNMSSKDSVSAIISTPNAGGEDYNFYESIKKCR